MDGYTASEDVLKKDVEEMLSYVSNCNRAIDKRCMSVLCYGPHSVRADDVPSAIGKL